MFTLLVRSFERSRAQENPFKECDKKGEKTERFRCYQEEALKAVKKGTSSQRVESLSEPVIVGGGKAKLVGKKEILENEGFTTG